MRTFLRSCLLASWFVSCAWGYDISKFSGTDYLIVWPSSSGTATLPMQIKLPVTEIATGKTYTSVLQEAMATWNTKLGTLQFTSTSTATPILSTPVGGDSPTYEGGDVNLPFNEIVVDSSIDGDAFEGNTLAVTVSYSRGNLRVESDIVFNAAKIWSAYPGNHQQNAEDLRRVALHELGHVLGLLHPDQAGQTVSALMNSVVSNLDDLTGDDITGAQVMYGAPGVIPANNNFANAFELITGGGLAFGNGTSVGASKEPGEPNPAPGTTGGRSIWWKWTATGSGPTTVTTQGSGFDTILGIYTGGAVNSLSLVGGNDDEEPTGDSTRKRTSIVTFNAANGTTYYFMVDGWDGEQGPISISMTFNGVVNTAPNFTNHPTSQVQTAGFAIGFSVSVSGIPAPTLQWQRRPAGSGTWSDLGNGGNYSGVTGTTLTVSNTTTAMSGDQFRCVATNFVGSATSASATLTVIAPLAADFNADGKSDIFWTNTATGERSMWFMNGGSVGGGTSLGLVPVEWTVSATTDFNGDGKADILLTNTTTGDRAMWLMNGSIISQNAFVSTVPVEWQISGTGDFNGDGKADIFWTNANTGDRAIWLMNGSAMQLGSAYLTTLSTQWLVSGTGDFNGDGKADVLWTNTVTGERSMWFMNGATVAGGMTLGTVPVTWVVSGTADFNGDGKADILLTNTATGDRAMWLMNGASIAVNAFVSTVPVEWQVSRTDDYNGDGKADIFWTNIVTGDRAIWLMNGSVMQPGSAYLTTVPVEWVIGQ